MRSGSFPVVGSVACAGVPVRAWVTGLLAGAPVVRGGAGLIKGVVINLAIIESSHVKAEHQGNVMITRPQD